MAERMAFSIEELAKAGPLGRSSIYKGINTGALIARKFGRSTVILREDWERFLTTLPRIEPQGRAA